MEPAGTIRPITTPATEGIDFNKLSTIFRKNWLWIVMIFIVVNAVAYLILRYSKNLYESESELKLDVKTNASEFGIKSIVDDQNLNIISGEIEILRSRLFLNQVLDHSNFEVSFYSEGRVWNAFYELYGNPPAFITYYNKNHSLYDTKINFTEIDKIHYSLRIGENGDVVNAKYGEKVVLKDLELILIRNNNFITGDEVGYYFVINSRGALLNYLISNLTAEPRNYNANTIGVSFKDHNPIKAQAVLYKIDTLYLKYSYEQKNLANRQKIEWLSNELKHIEERMEDYENYFENFTLKNKTSDLNEDLRKIIPAINQIDSQRFELSRKINAISEFIKSLSSPEFQPSINIRHSLPAGLEKTLEQLQQNKLDMEKLKLSHREVTFAYRQKQKEFESLKAKVDRELAEVKNEWVRRLEELNKKKEQLENEFVTLPDKSTQFSKNQRFYKLYEEFYLTLMQSKSEFEIAQAGSIPDFKILSPASFPVKPISPNSIMIAGIGIVMSIVMNFFFIGILYLLNNKITSLNDLEKMSSAPVLGVVPVTKYSNGTGLYISDYPKSMVSEAIRTLRTNLDFFNVTSKKKTIAISSTVSGEGKSFIAMNLGGVIALSKKKVILIDLDMRKSKTNFPAALEDQAKGVSTILIRKHAWRDCIVKTSLENFDFIPSGPHPPNPSELLLNGEFAELLEELKQQYDFIILDTPPVGLVTDGIMAMKRADISVYIFRANYSKKEFLRNLQRIISINKFSNITTLLNAVPVNTKTYGYGYYEENGGSKLKSALKI